MVEIEVLFNLRHSYYNTKSIHRLIKTLLQSFGWLERGGGRKDRRDGRRKIRREGGRKGRREEEREI